MSDIFGEPAPLRAVLHVNLWSARTRLDWDILVTNAATGDVLCMEAHPALPAHKLGPELSRMLLRLLEQLGADGASQPRESTD